MAPRLATHLLGLCNVVAGALVACAPVILMPGLNGLDSPGARLLGVSLGVVLVSVGIGAWLIPADGRRVYLWIFGVAVKVVASAVWGAAALTTGVAMLAAGAALDLAVALAIAGMLSNTR
ncbi:hypothetical protein LuPra_05476 [Luteitalea pratensis]|uniref:Uncharacterized protein n=1 Tax=Luteitalea pratensis TaxID=1855912 RepID=A0A143PVL9_LUTPR|nr:hypothetical protein [Luteitalea pratensis]AMY12203.1 hypothetical protein LuPra_05476 [Luteitalea pratensis]